MTSCFDAAEQLAALEFRFCCVVGRRIRWNLPGALGVFWRGGRREGQALDMAQVAPHRPVEHTAVLQPSRLRAHERLDLQSAQRGRINDDAVEILDRLRALDG
ncbi:hypothetical protein CSW60_09585 [Caulobacter sp. X]|nr:hypothetical protein CSW60_09585 [Caulobacter sp. X]